MYNQSYERINTRKIKWAITVIYFIFVVELIMKGKKNLFHLKIYRG